MGQEVGHAVFCRSVRRRALWADLSVEHVMAGTVIWYLTLVRQPACDHFPRADDPGPDPLYPLQMWLCSSCGLAQLVADPTVPEEPRGVEPAALVAQAADAVERVAEAGLVSAGATLPSTAARMEALGCSC